MDAFWKNQIRGYIHTGSWNLVCRNGWLGLQVLFLHLNVANVKKKKMRYLTFKKSRFLAFLEKKILSKGLAWLHLLLHLYQSASTVQELPSLEVACVVQFPAISMAPEVIQTLRSHDRCLSPLHYLSLPVFRVCPPWTGWIHSEELLPFTWVIWLVCFLRNTNNIVTTQMRGRLICLRLSSSIIIWR